MDVKKTDESKILCQKCGKNKHQTGTEMLVLENGFALCLGCINLMAWVGNNAGKRRFRETEQGKNLPTPHEMKNYLDEFVIGQDRAKKTIAVAVYEHYKRILQESEFSHPEIKLKKNNIMLIGGTGCGKTYIAETIAKMLDVPFAISDVSALTAAGYVGGTVDNLLMPLVNAGDFDASKIQNGIMVLDEIDKLRDQPSSSGKDVGGASAQQQLLKILEGDIIKVKEGDGHHARTISIDTTNILFICIGSFAGIDQQMQKKHCNKNQIGIGKDVKSKKILTTEEITQKITNEDLLDFGMMPELMGRIPVLAKLSDLDVDALTKILQEPKNSIVDQFKYSCQLDGVKLNFEKEALEEIARLSIKQKAGARGLRGIIVELMLDIMFDIPSNPTMKKITVTKEMVIGEEGEEQKTLLM